MNKKYFFLLTLLFAFLGGVKSYSINTNAGIVAKQIYQIRAKDTARGVLYAGNTTNNGAHPDKALSAAGSTYTSNGYNAFRSITINTADRYQQFAFIEAGGAYYLYSVGARSLCYVNDGKIIFGTTVKESITLTAATSSGNTSYAIFKFNTSNRYLTFSNGGGQYAINPQTGTLASSTDGGDLIAINPVSGATLSDDELFYAQNLIDNRSANPLATAENFLNTTTATQVGYPKAPSRATLQAAIDVYKPLVEANNVTLAAYNTFSSALTAYLSDMDVNMPEDGKAYRVYAKYLNGKKQPLYWNGSAIRAKNLENITNADDAVWVFHKIPETDNKYLLVNHNGKYLIFFESESSAKGQNTNGCTDDYTATNNNFTISRATITKPNGGDIPATLTNADLYGCFELNAMGKSNNSYYLIPRYLGDNTDASFHAGNANDKYYMSNGNTYVFEIEEVEYYNKLVFRSPATPDGKYYASIYLPYAATVPTGATAYLGTLNGSSIRLTDIQGSVIPKNTAVVMVAESDLATQYIAPATEAGSVPAGVTNSLKGTLTTTERTADMYADTYVLNGNFGNIGFYKYTATNLPKGRAYFEVQNSGVQGVQGFLFDFGEEGGETTGINAASLSNEAAKTYYDLSGRRIANPKNGLYICNGKKVYIK